MSNIVDESEVDYNKLSFIRSKTNDSSYVIRYNDKVPRIRFKDINAKLLITGSKSFTNFRSGKQSGRIFVNPRGTMRKVFTKLTDKLYKEYFGVSKDKAKLKSILSVSLKDDICKVLWVDGKNKKVSFKNLINIISKCKVDIDISVLSFWITKDGYEYDNYYKKDKKHVPKPSNHMNMTYYINSIHINDKNDIEEIKNLLKMDSGIVDLPKVDKSKLNIIRQGYTSNREIIKNIMACI